MNQSKNLRAMIERKKLIRQGTPEAEGKADRILRAVEESGGLSTEEVYSLMAYWVCDRNSKIDHMASGLKALAKLLETGENNEHFWRNFKTILQHEN